MKKSLTGNRSFIFPCKSNAFGRDDEIGDQVGISKYRARLDSCDVVLRITFLLTTNLFYCLFFPSHFICFKGTDKALKAVP